MAIVLRHVAHYLKPFLELSALILGIVNGCFVLRLYLRDRPKLKVRPVHPKTYQWWFKLPTNKRAEIGETRRYGFLVYVDILNLGLRKTELESWTLEFDTIAKGKHRMNPLSMPEPQFTFGELVKIYAVLGQKGIHSDGSTLVEPGCSLTGVSFFEYECFGPVEWNPRITNLRIKGKLRVKSVFGQTSDCEIEFSEKPWKDIDEFAPGIHLVSIAKDTIEFVSDSTDGDT